MKIPKILILLVFITSCSSKTISSNSVDNVQSDNAESKFEKVLQDYIDSSNSSVKEAFTELFGMDKAKQEAKTYCEKLDKGSTQFKEDSDIAYDLKKKVENHIITDNELDSIESIYFFIHYLAQDTYCPQHKSLEQKPLNERMK